MSPPPMLDPQLAFQITGFLHWMQVTLQRVHRLDADPFVCLEDAQDAAESSAYYLNDGGLNWFTSFPKVVSADVAAELGGVR